MDREEFAAFYEQHFLPSISTGFCRCGFKISKTEPGDRDHARGWSTSATHMRKSYARHLADEFNRI